MKYVLSFLFWLIVVAFVVLPVSLLFGVRVTLNFFIEESRWMADAINKDLGELIGKHRK